MVAKDSNVLGQENSKTKGRDLHGASSAYRLMTYAVKLLQLPDILLSLDTKQRATLFYYLPLTVQLADDDASIENSLGLIGTELAEDRDEALEIISEGHAVINGWLHPRTLSEENEPSVSKEFLSFWRHKITDIKDTLPESYRIGQTYARVYSEAALNTIPGEILNLGREVRKYNPIRAAAELFIWGPCLATSPMGTRLCNELIADITAFKPRGNSLEGNPQPFKRSQHQD